MKVFINLFVILAFANTVRLVSTEDIMELPVTMKMEPPVVITMTPPWTKTLELPVSIKKLENRTLNPTVADISGPTVSTSSIPSASDVSETPISETSFTSEVTILEQPVSTTSITTEAGISSEPPVSTTLHLAFVDSTPSLATYVEEMASKSLEPPLTTSTTTATTSTDTIAYRTLEQPFSTTLKSPTTTTLNSSGSLTNEPILTTTVEPSVTDEGPPVTTTEFNPCLVEPPELPDFSAPNRRISEQKCYEYIWNIEYREVVWKQSIACSGYLYTHQDPDEFPSRPVLGGRDAYPREFPNMGALGWKAVIGDWVFKCGSTLISDKFLLTAAHCSRVASRDTTVADPVPKLVRLGQIDVKDPKRPINDYTISRIITHPKYHAPKQYYDIALIEVEKNVDFDGNVHPSCLWTSSDTSFAGQHMFVSGWGEVKRGRTFRYTEAQRLQVGKVNFLDSQICDELLQDVSNRKWWGVSEHQICAGKLSGATDTCQGDSGGPLQVPISVPKKDLENSEYLAESMNYVVGVTSFGIGCGQKNFPGVYTRVASFVDWIEGIVWPDEFKERYLSLIWPE